MKICSKAYMCSNKYCTAHDPHDEIPGVCMPEKRADYCYVYRNKVWCVDVEAKDEKPKAASIDDDYLALTGRPFYGGSNGNARTMQCNQEKSKKCTNMDRSKCVGCVAPMWCMCQRECVVKGRRELWKSATAEKVEAGTQPPTGQVSPCSHEWEYGMFQDICSKCGLVDDA